MTKILVSGCLFGWSCRYDGKARPCEDEIFSQWRAEGRLVPFCPEQEGGLPTPRKPCEIVGNRVVTKDGEDCTAQYQAGAEAAVSCAKECGAGICVLKENSPSCGTMYIYDGTFSRQKIKSSGLAAIALRKAGFPVFSEEELHLANAYLKNLEKNTKPLEK